MNCRLDMPLFRAFPSGSVKRGPRKLKTKIGRREERSCGSLARLCLWSLAENMKDIWAKDYTQNYMDQYCFRYIMGPFNMLPGNLVEELLSLLSSRRLLTRGALHLLLLPQLRRLSLAPCSGLVTSSLCQLIGVRCPSLLSLDLSGAQQLCSPVLCELLEALPCLRSLSLAGTPCDGRVVGTAAARCPALQHLDVSRCHRLPPAGLLSLAPRPGGGYPGPPLRTLLALDIGFGEEEGDRAWVAAFLLLALPLLARAALEDLGEACRLIAGRDFARGDGFAARVGVPSLGELWARRVRGEAGGVREEFSDGGEDEGWVADESEDEEESGEGEGAPRTKEGRKASLSEGQGGAGEEGHSEMRLALCLQEAQGVSIGALGVLGRVCPHLRSLALSGEEGAGPDDARVMARWAGQLHSLTLTLHCPGGLWAVLPVVQAVGASLSSLTLEGVRVAGNASFLQLLRSCPSLKTLHVLTDHPGSTEEEDEEEDEEDVEANLRDLPSLPLLHSLKLNFLLDQSQKRPVMSWRDLKWALVALLGGSPLLEKVSLAAFPCPLDDVFLAVRRSPPPPPEPAPLQRLRDLSMTRCDISEGMVMLLVSSMNCLSFLDLSGCWSVSGYCIMELQEKATRRRYPLTVVWT